MIRSFGWAESLFFPEDGLRRGMRTLFETVGRGCVTGMISIFFERLAGSAGLIFLSVSAIIFGNEQIAQGRSGAHRRRKVRCAHPPSKLRTALRALIATGSAPAKASGGRPCKSGLLQNHLSDLPA